MTQADVTAIRRESENVMYRVYRVHRDNNGKIFHKVPVGCARTEKGARALAARSGRKPAVNIK